MSPKDMTVAQLDEYLTHETNALDRKRDELREIRKIRDQKAGQDEAAAQLAKMSPEAQAALTAHLAQKISSAGAVKSAESVKGLAGK